SPRSRRSTPVPRRGRSPGWWPNPGRRKPAPPPAHSWLRSPARRLAPKILVQLHLQAYRQAFVEDPLREVARLDLAVGRAEQHRADLVQASLTHQVARPVEIRAIADHELDLLLGAQRRQVVEPVALDLAAARRLDVDHAHHAWVDLAPIDGAAGFQGDVESGVAQRG